VAARLIECVPNFSEGRDPAKFAAIRDAIGATAGVALLGAEMDPDHHRSVMTFAGEPEAVYEAAYAAVAAAQAAIDMRTHSGVHPRIGAADVVPFVPIEGVALEECAALAHRLGARVWERLRVPVYFYEAAALHADRVRLENVRRGGYRNPALAPDLGSLPLHPSAGGCIIGARRFLIAFNINLNTTDVEIAQAIASNIRSSSGGLPHVKAMGVFLQSRNLAQVSMNLTDFEQTPLYEVVERVRAEAAAFGVSVAGSQIVGLIPKKAMEQVAASYLQVEKFHADVILENRLTSASNRLPLQE
jgi:glutamate formiminotransferase